MRVFERRLCAGLLLLVALPAHADIERLHHDLTVHLDPAALTLRGEDTIKITAKGVINFTLGPGFSLTRLMLDDKEVAVASPTGQKGQQTWSLELTDQAAEHTLSVSYQGKLAPLAALDDRAVLGHLPAMASAEGSYLPAASGWYPTFSADTLTYRITLDVPDNQRGLTPGRLVDEQQINGRYRATFEFPHPTEGIALMAAPYQVKEVMYKNLRLRTYFHPEIAQLADDYLNSISGYIDLYNDWIGAYPYTEFSIVSSPLPTGFGLPTLTYLGINVLRLPFIRHSSLGHEILHNWWGNGVYADWRHGNWSEGLTNFMADYTYKERQGADAARAQRLSWLRDFAAIPEGQDEPLMRFTSRHHSASQTIGYHKAAFLFFMLRDELGADAFNQGLRQFWKEQQFRTASWLELQRAFETASGKKLDGFFSQWLTQSGAAQPVIRDTQLTQQDGTYRIAVTLAQPAPAYRLRVPLVITTAEGKEEHIVELTQEQQDYILKSTARPVSLALDPDLKLFRRLDSAELPPILRQIIADPATLTVIPDRDASLRETARQLAGRLLDHPPRFRDEAATPEIPSPLLVIGTHQEIAVFLKRHKLPAQPAVLQDRGSAQAWAARQANGKTLVVVSAADHETLQALLRPLPHYGKESFIVFQNNKVIDKGVWATAGNERKLSPE